jgi:hypothetical protein
MNLKHIIELSDWWQRQQNQINEAIPLDADMTEWPGLTKTIVTLDGYHIETLNTFTLLKEEGDQMGHCISSYSHECLEGNKHVVSIRDPQGNRLSTAELRIGLYDVSIAQHVGPKNSTASAEATHALQWYVDNINQRKIVVEFDKLYEHRKKMAEQKNSLTKFIGFDPKQEEKCQRAFDKYHPYFIRKKSIATAIQFIDQFKIVEQYLERCPDDAKAEQYCEQKKHASSHDDTASNKRMLR